MKRSCDLKIIMYGYLVSIRIPDGGSWMGVREMSSIIDVGVWAESQTKKRTLLGVSQRDVWWSLLLCLNLELLSLW
jgi:hypothetical protein